MCSSAADSLIDVAAFEWTQVACVTGQHWLSFPTEKAVRNSTPGDCKTTREDPEWRRFYASESNLAAKVARKPCLGGPESHLGRFLALLELSWRRFGRSWGVPGRSWGPLEGRVRPSKGLLWTIWTMSVALRETQ